MSAPNYLGTLGRNVQVKLGSELSPEDQVTALCAFVHRFTKQHRPHWANRPWKNGQTYPVQFASDEDWLANSYFAVCKDGSLSEGTAFCESHPTWPDNPELRKPEFRNPAA